MKLAVCLASYLTTLVFLKGSIGTGWTKSNHILSISQYLKDAFLIGTDSRSVS